MHVGARPELAELARAGRKYTNCTYYSMITM